MSGTCFSKLEALGNDFMLLDRRDGRGDPSPDQIRGLADRKTGVGFDQLLILGPSSRPDADTSVSLYNSDGSTARQCGNGMRAIGLWLSAENPARRQFMLDTAAGPIEVRVESPERITVGMGQPDFGPAAVGLAPTAEIDKLLVRVPGLLDFGTVSVGNPHLILLLEQPATPETVSGIGHDLSTWPGFNDGINVSFAHVGTPQQVDLQVHERGAGPTLACGSAACATAAWLLRDSRAVTPVCVSQPGGMLVIDWHGEGHPIWMTGPARRVYDGKLG